MGGGVLKASDCTFGVPDDYISVLEIMKSCSRQRRRTDQSSDRLEIDILRRRGWEKKNERDAEQERD